MKPLMLVVTAVSVISGCTMTNPKVDAEAQIQRGETIIAEFQSSLGKTLKGAMASGGIPEAINVCHSQASLIANEVGERYGVEVRRVTNQSRNPANRPDAMDKDVLMSFSKAVIDKQGNSNPTTKWISEKENTRYYKAITIQPLCLTCHGSQLDPKTSATIDALYPEDAATGYQLGDLRGSFVVEF